MKENIKHPFAPLYDSNSKILILGSFPSAKSREEKFFYGHPQNRFWKVMANVLNEPLPITSSEKASMLLRNKIALWDSIASCDITASSDASISNVIPNDLSIIFNSANICAVFCNGKKAHQLYGKYIQPISSKTAICLPSTSPANAAWTLEKLSAEYHRALSPYLL